MAAWLCSSLLTSPSGSVFFRLVLGLRSSIDTQINYQIIAFEALTNCHSSFGLRIAAIAETRLLTILLQRCATVLRTTLVLVQRKRGATRLRWGLLSQHSLWHQRHVCGSNHGCRRIIIMGFRNSAVTVPDRTPCICITIVILIIIIVL